jgi:tellurite resistance protein
VPSARELLDDWLAVLTLMGERGQTADAAAEVFTRSIGRRGFTISLETRVTRRDQEQLAAFTAAIGETFNRQATVHWLVEERLIEALGRATGESRAEIIQQLALGFSESDGGLGTEDSG